MLELSENYSELIGFEDKSDETAMDKYSRSKVIDFMCRLGSQECLNRMQNKLKSHIDEEEKLPVNLETSVFCFGLMASTTTDEGPRLIEALWKEMQASGSVEYRLRIIDALGCYGNVKILTDLLETILGSNTEVKYLSKENFEIIKSVYSNTDESVEATIDFIIEYQNDAVRRSQKNNLMEILVDELSKRIYNERLFEKVS
jgi:hypothetical protein